MTLKEAIVLRHSVRKYLDKPIEATAREAMNRLAAECNAESGLHIQIIYDDSTCFPALLAHFGMFRNAKNYIALVGKSSVPDLSGICGYYGQRLVLAAQQQGLNTCWIGGSYKKKKTGAERSSSASSRWDTVKRRAVRAVQSPWKHSAMSRMRICRHGSVTASWQRSLPRRQ